MKTKEELIREYNKRWDIREDTHCWWHEMIDKSIEIGKQEAREEISNLRKRLFITLQRYSEICHKYHLVDFYAILDKEIKELQEKK